MPREVTKRHQLKPGDIVMVDDSVDDKIKPFWLVQIESSERAYTLVTWSGRVPGRAVASIDNLFKYTRATTYVLDDDDPLVEWVLTSEMRTTLLGSMTP